MRPLWFKQHFVDAILSGCKTDTIRLPPRRKMRRLSPGEQVGLSVGPRTPFAVAVVVADETILAGSLDADRRAQVEACYGRLADDALLYRTSFQVIDAEPMNERASFPPALAAAKRGCGGDRVLAPDACCLTDEPEHVMRLAMVAAAN